MNRAKLIGWAETQPALRTGRRAMLRAVVQPLAVDAPTAALLVRT